jgi:hypothetical protein
MAEPFDSVAGAIGSICRWCGMGKRREGAIRIGSGPSPSHLLGLGATSAKLNMARLLKAGDNYSRY